MKKLHHVLAVAAMLLLVVALLITSFQLAIYGDPGYGFYEREYEKYHVAESLDMEMGDVMDVTEKMMDYLIGKRPELSVITDVDGQTQDFFNEQDRLHMADVKNLFLGGLPRRYEEAEGPCKLEACRFTIDTEKKRCVEVRRADLWE